MVFEVVQFQESWVLLLKRLGAMVLFVICKVSLQRRHIRLPYAAGSKSTLLMKIPVLHPLGFDPFRITLIHLFQKVCHRDLAREQRKCMNMNRGAVDHERRRFLFTKNGGHVAEQFFLNFRSKGWRAIFDTPNANAPAYRQESGQWLPPFFKMETFDRHRASVAPAGLNSITRGRSAGRCPLLSPAAPSRRFETPANLIQPFHDCFSISAACTATNTGTW